MLYHKELRFPSTLRIPEISDYFLVYSKHALGAAENDRYGKIKLPKYIRVYKKEIIEIETNDNVKVEKS